MATETEIRSAPASLRDIESLGGRRYSVLIFVNEKPRDTPFELSLRGLDFTNYEKNPTVLWAHDQVGRTESAGLPIGRTLSLSSTSEGVRAIFEFIEGDAFVDRVHNAWAQGFLRSASIGWRDIEIERLPGGEIRIVKSEMLEWSLVSVPLDPDALRDAHSRMMKAMIEDEPEQDRVIFDHTRSAEVTPKIPTDSHTCLDEDAVRAIVKDEVNPDPESDTELDLSEMAKLFSDLKQTLTGVEA